MSLFFTKFVKLDSDPGGKIMRIRLGPPGSDPFLIGKVRYPVLILECAM